MGYYKKEIIFKKWDERTKRRTRSDKPYQPLTTNATYSENYSISFEPYQKPNSTISWDAPEKITGVYND
ncbi:hypothetical protein [Carboxylicivirga sp. RSCT41]|uniref:hypothetical protein n=1 Tax=Carboxylicivirga agarovorans TaxID=3417570 RepID=UPI003D344B99